MPALSSVKKSEFLSSTYSAERLHKVERGACMRAGREWRHLLVALHVSALVH